MKRYTISTNETSLSAKLNTVTKENAKLKKELAQLKNDYKDALTSEEADVLAEEICRATLYYACRIFCNPKAMEMIEAYAVGCNYAGDREKLLKKIIVGYIKHAVKREKGQHPFCNTFLDVLVREIYDIINPQKRKGGETKVAKCTKCRKTSAHKR